MPEAFKLHFSISVIETMAKHIASACDRAGVSFNINRFISQASEGLDALELKARSNQIMQALQIYMPADFELAASIIVDALGEVSSEETIQSQGHAEGLAGWMMMPVTDYITASALKHDDKYIDAALETLRACTQRFSAEFSIRPFLRDYPEQTLNTLKHWRNDESVHVRRLVSEGSRPYLPWGLRLHRFCKNPSAILPLLESLKNDPSEYVRRSVANSLNDIAKDHPDLVAAIAKKWWKEGDMVRTKLIRHACRTLLKEGHPEVLTLFGFPPADLSGVLVKIQDDRVKIGDEQVIEVTLTNDSNKAQNLLVDYAMHHQKANGKMSPKVFKWTSLLLPANTQRVLSKHHTFKPVTTRKYYAGQHKVEILINGKAHGDEVFDLYY